MHISDAADILRQDIPEPRFIVQDILPEGGKTLLFSRPKAGKTTITLDLALSLVYGVEWLGFAIPSPVKVLFCQLEVKPQFFAKQLKRIAGEARNLAKDKLLICYEPLSMATQSAYDKVRKLIGSTKPQVVIFDPFVFLAGPSELGPREVGMVLRHQDALSAEFGLLGIVNLHHT
jgi:RecA-family ATPase